MTSSDEGRLEVRVNLADARFFTFRTETPTDTARILDSINPGKFFESKQLLIGCSDNLSAFQSSHVTHVELTSGAIPPWPFHHNVRVIRTITADEYTAILRNGSYVRQPLGDTVFSVAEMELSSGLSLYLHITVNTDPAITVMMPFDHHTYLTQLFSAGGLHVRAGDTGALLINPSHIARLTMYPGAEQPPAAVWKAGKCS